MSNLADNLLNYTFNQIEKYRELDQQIKLLTQKRDEIKSELQAGFFLNEEQFEFNGRLIATYKPHIRISFNQTLFKEKEPKLYEEYLEPRYQKVFLIK